MKLKLQHIILIGILMIPATMYYLSIDASIKFLSSLNFANIHVSVFIVFSIFLSYFGAILINKITIMAITFVIQKLFIIKITTMAITFLVMIFLFTNLENYNLEISNNDRGILYEIMGFFIYLNPINKYLTKILKEKNDQYIDHELIVKSTAVTLVVAGLILQLSHFS